MVVRNRTLGTTAAGGMSVGTVIGVLVIPGLYYLFGRLADGRKLLQDEVNGPLSELFEPHDDPLALVSAVQEEAEPERDRPH